LIILLNGNCGRAVSINFLSKGKQTIDSREGKCRKGGQM